MVVNSATPVVGKRLTDLGPHGKGPNPRKQLKFWFYPAIIGSFSCLYDAGSRWTTDVGRYDLSW